MKITGTIKVLSFKGDRVIIKLDDAQFLSKEGKWEKQYGDVWISSFDDHVIQSVRLFDEDDDSNNIKKGSEIQAVVKSNQGKDGRTYLNIVNVGLRVKEVDVLEEVPPDEPLPEEETPPEEEKSTTVDTTTTEYRIVFQACLKAVGASNLAQSFQELIEMAERATQRTFKGK